MVLQLLALQRKMLHPTRSSRTGILQAQHYGLLKQLLCHLKVTKWLPANGCAPLVTGTLAIAVRHSH